MDFEIDCLVIGAGVIGLACAARISESRQSVIIAEASKNIGSGISSRNSEVIHAGIYYKLNSQKHLLCLKGQKLLYSFLDKYSIPYNKCGKLIVATSLDEEEALAGIERRAKENGVVGIENISVKQAKLMEPELNCVEALWSPSTGIIDSHAYMEALLGQFESNGGAIAFDTSIVRCEPLPTGGFKVWFTGLENFTANCRHIVNAAGLHAHKVANSIETYPANWLPELYLVKGNYFSTSTRSPFSRLIYPIPVRGGLGTHLTFDLAGQMRFGPDVEWLDTKDPDHVNFAVDANRSVGFYESIRRYWPRLEDNSLNPDYAGCRPKLNSQSETDSDFTIFGPSEHKIEGLINLFGIESPGLTSSLSIAEIVYGKLYHGL